jgi:glycosyltransferase involved in cell wall biosynthesis
MVSVIIPTYNSGKSTIIAVKSVLIQTFTNWEIIIIDDGSTDDTFTIITIFLQSLQPQERYKIQLYKQLNQGPSSARNKGIELAKGEFIAFLDSDDEWKENKLKIQLNYFEKDSDLFFCATAFGKKRIDKKLDYKYISFSNLLFRNFFSTPTVIVKSILFKRFQFDIYQKYSEDYKLWLEIAHEYKCIYVNSILAKNQYSKEDFGESGLSSNLWEMEKGELSNYLYLFKFRKIMFCKLLICCSNSLLKYFFRVVKTKMNKVT